ncbi:MAG TPA: hypothetical protein VN935_05935 [Rhizomicrobium sp.]|jgi:hypothetical protein|nr:hypothetical protein [Rhizomicrobium sp.]
MAFSFDSLSFDLLGALVLLAVSVWSWRMARGLRAQARIPLRFAAVLLAAFAASLAVPAPGLAFNVILLTAGVAGVALALAFCFRHGAPQWLSATALAVAFVTGLIASLAAMPLLAFAAVAAACAYILSACPLRARGNLRAGLAAMLGATALFLGSLAMLDGGLAQVALFFAAALGLVTRALQKPVEDPDARIELLVGGKRA